MSRRGTSDLQQRLAEIAEASSDFIGISNAIGETVYVNRAGRAMLGFGEDEDLTGVPIAIYHSEEAARRVRDEQWTEVLKSGAATFENTVRHRDGHDIPVSQLLMSHRGQSGAVEYLSTVMRDMRAQRRVAEELRQTEERLRSLVDNLHVGVIVQDRDANVLLSNHTALELLGLTVDQLLGKASRDADWNVIHEDGNEFPLELHPATLALATGRPVRNVTLGVYRPATRDRVWLLVHAEPELDESGRVLQVVCTYSDITDRKLLESSLVQAQKMEAVGRLAGGVAHDFNNLLTVIGGYLDLSVTAPTLDGQVRDDLELALKATQRAASLTRQLLAFARRDVVSPGNVDINAVLATVQGMLRRLIAEHITIEVHATPGVWVTRIDPSQLEQVILNLAVNAADAIGGRGLLTFETANVVLDSGYASRHVNVEPGDYVMLAVTDTGPGIPEELHAHIFEPFFTTKGAGKGTGLGLATVHGIVKSNGGHVALHSAAGVGACFKVYLPRSRGAVDPEPALHESGPRAAGEAVLLVEDEDLVRNFAYRVLAGAGYRVIEADNPQHALEIARAFEGKLEALVTDVVMPKMSGRELADMLVAERPDLVVLYVSGYAQTAVAQHGVLEQGIEFLAKPYTPKQLLTRVREVLDARVVRS
ncbi:MAG TPA: PAS domain S-box protein [Polyangiaceae bacterium]|nr:PAS domain S-box protein [Polyangiaceae bacterium]